MYDGGRRYRGWAFERCCVVGVEKKGAQMAGVGLLSGLSCYGMERVNLDCRSAVNKVSWLSEKEEKQKL
jgi:hypothetical protein